MFELEPSGVDDTELASLWLPASIKQVVVELGLSTLQQQVFGKGFDVVEFDQTELDSDAPISNDSDDYDDGEGHESPTTASDGADNTETATLYLLARRVTSSSRNTSSNRPVRVEVVKAELRALIAALPDYEAEAALQTPSPTSPLRVLVCGYRPLVDYAFREVLADAGRRRQHVLLVLAPDRGGCCWMLVQVVGLLTELIH